VARARKPQLSFKRLNQIASGLMLRAASVPINLLGMRTRASAIEQLSERMLATVGTGAGPIRFFCPSPQLATRAETLLTKEPDMIRWIDGFEGNSVFWDIGANVGVFSLYAGARRGVSVLSFEPSAANFYVLSRNIQLNQLDDRVTAYCLALSGRTELGVLNMASVAMGSAMSQFGRPGEMSRYCEKRTNGVAQGMIGFTVDDFIARFCPAFPNYLKMDVDGLELPILQGARNTLRDPRLRSLMVELSLSNKEEGSRAVALLEESGFHFVSHGETQGTEVEKAANHLFERYSKP